MHLLASYSVRDKNFFNIKAKKKKEKKEKDVRVCLVSEGGAAGKAGSQRPDYLSSYFGTKAPSSARQVSNLSFRMSATIIPSFVTSFDQRMKNCRLAQTKLFLGLGGGGQLRYEELAKVRGRPRRPGLG